MTDKLSCNMRGIFPVVGKYIYNTPSHNGGWIFIPAMISATVVLGVYSLIRLTAAAAPNIPGERHVRYIYGLYTAGQLIHMTMNFILVAIIAGH